MIPSDDQLSVKTFSGLERLSLCPPSHDDKDIFKYPPSRKSSVEINSYKNDIYTKTRTNSQLGQS